VCVDVYAYICAGVHVCVYMHMRVRPCTRTCARVCMRMRVHAYAQMEGSGGGASACLAVSWARVRTHVHVHACASVYAWARMCTACSECYIHPKTLIEIAMVLSTNSGSFPSNSHVSANFSILLRFGEFWNPTNCEKFNADGSLMGRTNLDKFVW